MSDRRRAVGVGTSTVVAWAIAVAGCVHVAAQPSIPAAAAPTFDRYEVVTTAAARQTVLTGFLLDGAMAELAVVHVNR